MKKTVCGIIIAILLLGVISVVLDYRGFDGNSVTVSIPQGTGATEIVRLLKENKVIVYSSLFTRYISEDAANLKAGVHTFTKSMGYKKALEELKQDVPLENSVSITIPEGYEAREIGLLLEDSGITTATAFEEACKEAHTRFSFLPTDGNIEGYLFPATYDFVIGSRAVTVVDSMVETFQKKMLTEENLNRAEELSMPFHDILTLASIIEREAAMDEERALVSSVFHNRLHENMRLESCATVQYILEERKDILSVADTQINSPYNTYLNIGLPPAPIASPGAESLKAALYPENTNYLFFVADGTGGHTFSETYEAHMEAARLHAKNQVISGAANVNV